MNDVIERRVGIPTVSFKA
ncbi:MAG: hypothetical protein AAFR37_03325 [Cyanobacteria bacterium J06628_3]